MAPSANFVQYDGLIDLVVEQLVREIDEEWGEVKERPGKGASFGSNGMIKGNNGSEQSSIVPVSKQI
jgi:hypothetical protein